MQRDFPQKRLGWLLASLLCALPVQAAVTYIGEGSIPGTATDHRALQNCWKTASPRTI